MSITPSPTTPFTILKSPFTYMYHHPFTHLPHLSHTITPSQFVASGSRVKLYLPKDTCLITFILAGKSCFHSNMTTIVSMTTTKAAYPSIIFQW